MSKEKTKNKFKALGIKFDEYGNISVSYLKNPLDALKNNGWRIEYDEVTDQSVSGK